MGSQPYTEEDKAANRKASEVFHEKLDIWLKHGNGRVLIKGKPCKRSQSSFGKLVYPDLKKPQAQISKWYNAKLSPEPPRIPEDKLNTIIEIFNNDGIPTTKADFQIHSEEGYKYNTEAVEKYINDNYSNFLHDINFDGYGDKLNKHFNGILKSFHAFMLFAKSLSQYDSEFPLWTKIIAKPHLDKFPDYVAITDEYTRAPYSSLPDAAPSDNFKEFQVDKGADGIKVLQPEDMKYLIELYDKVKDFIYDNFKQHKKQLEHDALKAQIVALMRDVNSEDPLGELTDEEMCLIDSYYAEIRAKDINMMLDEKMKGDEK